MNHVMPCRKQACQARHQKAFTLVEMLASLLLTSLISLALLQIASSTRLSDQALSSNRLTQENRHALFDQISRLITDDLTQATKVHPTRDMQKQFSLTTSRSLTRELSTTHLESNVTYRIESLNGRSYFIREQSPIITKALLIQNSMMALRQSEWIAADILSVSLTEPEAHEQDLNRTNKQYLLSIEYMGEEKRETYARHILLP